LYSKLPNKRYRGIKNILCRCLAENPEGSRDFENLSRAVPLPRDNAGSRGIGLVFKTLDGTHESLILVKFLLKKYMIYCTINLRISSDIMAFFNFYKILRLPMYRVLKIFCDRGDVTVGDSNVVKIPSCGKFS